MAIDLYVPEANVGDFESSNDLTINSIESDYDYTEFLPEDKAVISEIHYVDYHSLGGQPLITSDISVVSANTINKIEIYITNLDRGRNTYIIDLPIPPSQENTITHKFCPPPEDLGPGVNRYFIQIAVTIEITGTEYIVITQGYNLVINKV